MDLEVCGTELTREKLMNINLSHLDQEPQTELAAQLAQEFYNFDVPLHIITNLAKLDFEVSLHFLFRPDSISILLG